MIFITCCFVYKRDLYIFCFLLIATLHKPAFGGRTVPSSNLNCKKTVLEFKIFKVEVRDCTIFTLVIGLSEIVVISVSRYPARYDVAVYSGAHSLLFKNCSRQYATHAYVPAAKALQNSSKSKKDINIAINIV